MLIPSPPPLLSDATTAARRLGQSRPLLLIGAGVLLYSTGPVMLQASSLSGPAFSFWRMLIGAAVLGMVTVASARLRRVPLTSSRQALRWPLLAGVAFGVHQLLFMTAVKMTSVVDVALMNALAPILTALGAWWVFRERPGPRFALGATVAIGGAAVLALAASDGPSGDPLGMAFAIGNVAFFAVFFLVSKRSRADLEVLPFLAGTMVVAATVVTAVVVVAGIDVGGATRADLLLATGVAIGPGALGHFVMTWPLSFVAANIPPVMRLAQPAIAGVLALLVLGEALGVHHLAGGAVVIAGAALAILSRDGRDLQRRAAASVLPTPPAAPARQRA